MAARREELYIRVLKTIYVSREKKCKIYIFKLPCNIFYKIMQYSQTTGCRQTKENHVLVREWKIRYAAWVPDVVSYESCSRVL